MPQQKLLALLVGKGLFKAYGLASAYTLTAGYHHSTELIRLQTLVLPRWAASPQLR